MSYELSQEQELLRKTIREFAEGVIKPKVFELDRKEEFSYDITKQMGELGLLGMACDPKYGGQGLCTLTTVIAIEELARVDASQAATVAAHNSLGIGPIEKFGNEAQKKKYLPDLCAGKKLWSFGLTEPGAGSDAANSKTTAVVKNGPSTGSGHGKWVINGSKIFITNGATKMTGGCTVQAVTGPSTLRQAQSSGRTDKKEISCILVDQNTKGFTAKEMHHKLVWRASNTAELYFDNVEVPEENILGKKGDGFKQMLATLDSGRLGIAAMGLGGAQGAFEAALKYSKERKAFEKPIASFQANAFKLADCSTEIEAARALLYKACWMKDEGKDFKMISAQAKLFCSEVMYRVVNHAVQIHGGYGLMEEYPVAKFYRDQKLTEIGEGTSEVQRIVISRKLGCYEDG